MHVVCVGISHKTAPLELRERLALDDGQAARLAHELLGDATVAEAVALSTCNRTEVYLFAGDTLAAERTTVSSLAECSGVAQAELEPCVYANSGDAAVTHLFRVAGSLDSMVVGEAQILAQIKNAFQVAADAGCTSTVFNKLFRAALEAGKRVRSETAIGERPVSVSSAAVELARQVFGKLDDKVVLVLGAGETSELTATHLRAHGISSIVVSSRTAENAEELAVRFGGRAATFDDLEHELAAADIVISSTSAPHYVVSRRQVETAMHLRKHKPIFFIDIAVPRDCDPEINRVDNAFLYDIDDLQQVVERNRGEREREAAVAERIVGEEVFKMKEWLTGLEVVPTIALLREAVDGIREAEIERLSHRMADLDEAQREHVHLLTTSIINKILHLPTVRMKEVAARKDSYVYVDVLRHLFGLNGSGPEVPGGQDDAAGDTRATGRERDEG